jgi:hypothetical protein
VCRPRYMKGDLISWRTDWITWRPWCRS